MEEAGDSNAQGAPTSAGCECDGKSTCEEHGRDFNWCKVKNPTDPLQPEKGIINKCPLFWDPTEPDPAGADHRVAGAGTPSPMWDYCRTSNPVDGGDPTEPQEDPAVPAYVHRGCKCGYRGNLLGTYGNDPEFRDKAGKFDWSRVPWRDRLGLEAMVVSYYRNKLAKDPSGKPMPVDEHPCVRTPSSGSLHICPAVDANDDPENPRQLGDPGWCGNHSWDFCIPADPKKALQARNEEVREERENAKLVGDSVITHEAPDPTAALCISIAKQVWTSRILDARRNAGRRSLGLAFL